MSAYVTKSFVTMEAKDNFKSPNNNYWNISILNEDYDRAMLNIIFY